MTEDTKDDNFTELAEAIRNLIEEAVRNGAFPGTGFSITLAGPAISQNPGNGDESPIPIRVTEPGIEVLDSPETRYITAELPGVDPGDIHFVVSGSELHLMAESQERTFRKTIPLEDADPDTLRYTFRNGILEFSLRKITGTAANIAGNP